MIKIPVEDLAAYAVRPAFHDRVRYALRPEHHIEADRELSVPVPVPDQEREPVLPIAGVE